MKRTLATAFLCLLLATSACTITMERDAERRAYDRAYIAAANRDAAAALYNEGLAAYDRDDWAAALREWRSLAEQGFPPAQYNLGLMYENGRGLPQDDAVALKWIRKAAEQDYPLAQVNLGARYYQGVRGASQDYVQASAWFRKAAELGYAPAQYALGGMYAGDRYGNSRGMPQDYVQAYKWYKLAAPGYRVGSYDEWVVKKMTPAQLAEAKRLAREWQAAFKKQKAR